MSVFDMSPNRMELARMKKRLAVSLKGHKLMKDKRDDLMKKFLELVEKNMELRRTLDKKMKEIYEGFGVAEALMGEEGLLQALMISGKRIKADVIVRNSMGIKAPSFEFHNMEQLEGEETEGKKVYSYGFAFTAPELDYPVKALNEALPLMLQLAQTEKTVRLMAEEIERTRRRVNALEHVQIPALQEGIRRIRLQLEEVQRGELARLMKVKDMMLREQRQVVNR